MTKGISRRQILRGCVAAFAAGTLPRGIVWADSDQSSDQPFDLLVRGGRVIDGSGGPAQILDVGVRDGRIAAIGDLKGQAEWDGWKRRSVTLPSRDSRYDLSGNDLPN